MPLLVCARFSDMVHGRIEAGASGLCLRAGARSVSRGAGMAPSGPGVCPGDTAGCSARRHRQSAATSCQNHPFTVSMGPSSQSGQPNHGSIA